MSSENQLTKIQLTSELFDTINDSYNDYIFYISSKLGTKKGLKLFIRKIGDLNSIYFLDRRQINIRNIKIWRTIDEYIKRVPFEDYTDNIKLFTDSADINKYIMEDVEKEKNYFTRR